MQVDQGVKNGLPGPMQSQARRWKPERRRVDITMMKSEKLFVTGESTDVEETGEATAYYLGWK
jgi:hypothetical protein